MPAITLKNPEVIRQGHWLRGVGYKERILKKGKDRTIEDIRLREYKDFQPDLSKDLKPASLKRLMTENESRAKSASSPNMYPIFEDNAVVEHEDQVSEVLDHMDKMVDEAIAHGHYTEQQRVDIKNELEAVRKCAKESWESLVAADVLSREADRLAGGANALLWRQNVLANLSQEDIQSQQDLADRIASGETLPKPPEPADAMDAMEPKAPPAPPEPLPSRPEFEKARGDLDKEWEEYDKAFQQFAKGNQQDTVLYEQLMEQRKNLQQQERRLKSIGRKLDKQENKKRPKPPEMPLMVQSEVAASKAVQRAKIGKIHSDCAVAAAKKAAMQSQEMRHRLEKLHSLVSDASMTADGLPENKDDAANARVANMTSEYEKAFAATEDVYTSVNARLNRAFWVSAKTKQVLRNAEAEKSAIEKERKQRHDRVQQRMTTRGSNRFNASERLEAEKIRKATPVEIKKALKEERRTRPPLVSKTHKTVATNAKRYFKGVRAPRKDDQGQQLSAKFGNLPRRPSANVPPADVPGVPRSYQTQFLKELHAIPADESVLAVAPTGAGKTFMFAQYVEDNLRKGKKVAVMAHRQELLDQIEETLVSTTGKRPGWVGNHRMRDKRNQLTEEWTREKDWSKPVTLISHGTVADKPTVTIPRDFNPDLLVIDEAHHAGAQGYQDIIDAMEPKQLVGFTATPYRGSGDGSELKDTFKHTVNPIDTETLIEQGYLVRPTVVDVQLTNKAGTKSPIREANNKPALYAQGVALARSAGRKKIIVFVSPGTQQDGGPVDELATDVVKETAIALQGIGGVSAHDILGSTDPLERAEAITEFKKRDEGILINYGTLNEGFDAPDTDAIILGRDVGSRGTLAQIAGRGMRYAKNKPSKTDVLILNYSGDPAETVLNKIYAQTKSQLGVGRKSKSSGAGAAPKVQQKQAGMPETAAPRRRRSSRRSDMENEGQAPNLTVRTSAAV